MKSIQFPASLHALATGLVTLLAVGLTTSSQAQSSPANDLTITVNELANGDVKFTASGTSRMLMPGSFYTTNADSNTMTPPQKRPLNLPQYVQLPEGMIFTLPEGSITSEEESAPEEGQSGPVVFPLNYLFFNSGFWHMGSYYSGFQEQGAPITGSGSITVAKSLISFSDFVPGTFKTRRTPWSMGEELYDLTYKVIPYSIGLEVAKPKRFPETQVDRSSSQTITVTNIGSLPISGLQVQIPQSGKKNFKIIQPKATSLEAGASTTFEAIFEPESEGTKSARITVTDGTSKKKVLLRGRGVDERVNSPRFPRRPGN